MKIDDGKKYICLECHYRSTKNNTEYEQKSEKLFDYKIGNYILTLCFDCARDLKEELSADILLG